MPLVPSPSTSSPGPATGHPSCTAPIAIVGLGCRYPGAATPVELWENIVARRRSFRRFPDHRLPLAAYSDPDRTAPNKIYSTQAALLTDFRFDWAARRIPRSTFASTDVVHWLALEAAIDAMRDAGRAVPGSDPGRIGVVVGNSLTGEGPRNVAVLTRWPFIAQTLRDAATKAHLPGAQLEQVLADAAERFQQALGEVDEDTLAGTLSNTIAGRICNHLDIHGGGYVVDGACASSLLAVITAARALIHGELDVAIAGGVDVSLDPYELVGFAKAGALTPDEMRVYDARANGFIPGEGAGFVVLERLMDARARGARVYAVITGWGISSDGRGGITAPSVEGQARAVRLAHAGARQPPVFVEGHGTGTAVGDRVEVQALQSALGTGQQRALGLTSLKSVIGHTKAAAGIGGLLKATMAASRRVIPPTAGCDRPSEVFWSDAPDLYPLVHGRCLPADEPMAVGVSAMGFGGINSHVRLEAGDAPDARLAPRLPEAQLLATSQDGELFVLGARDGKSLNERLRDLERTAAGIAECELTDLSAELAAAADPLAPCRAALVARRPAELAEGCARLATSSDDVIALSGPGGVMVRQPVPAPRIGLLFPGQGSQQIGMTRQLVERHPTARAEFDRWHAIAREHGAPDLAALLFRDLERAASPTAIEHWGRALADTRAAQPAITITSLLWWQQLRAYGVQPSMVAGHSLGELAALQVGGGLRPELIVLAATLRAQRMAEHGEPGGMVSLACDEPTVSRLLHGLDDVHVANHNGNRQFVVGGRMPALELLLERARQADVSARRLDVSHAFHTPLIAKAAPVFRRDLARMGLRSVDLQVPLLSSFCPAEGRQSRLELLDYLPAQIASPVRFAELVPRLFAEVDLAIEVGPGNVLTGLASGPGRQVLPTERRAESALDWLAALAVLYVRGGLTTLAPLHANRLVRPFVAPSPDRFLGNPMAATVGTAATAPAPRPRAAAAASQTPAARVLEPRPVVLELLAERTGFDRSGLRDEQRLLQDLNVDSIKAADLVATAAQRLGCTGQIDARAFAGATLGEVVSALDEATANRGAARPNAPPTPEPPLADDSSDGLPWLAALPPWLRSFRNVWRTAAPLRAATAPETDDPESRRPVDPQGVWLRPLFSPGPVGRPRRLALAVPDTVPDREAQAEHIRRLQQWIAGLPETEPGTRLVLVEHRQAEALRRGELPFDTRAWLASVHLERQLPCTWVSLPAACRVGTARALLNAELAVDTPWHAVRIDEEGQRLLPAHELLGQPRADLRLPAGAIVVTGGLTGITAQAVAAVAGAAGGPFVFCGRTPAARVQTEIQRWRLRGIACTYEVVDLDDHAALANLVSHVRKRHQRIAGVVHGAGTNLPNRVEATTAAEIGSQIAPKLGGLVGLLGCLADDPPDFVIALTSTIGHTGMPGNAWYALANASLARFMEHVRHTYGVTHALAIGFGLWNDIGLGARLDSARRLARFGVSGLQPADGARAFAAWLARALDPRDATTGEILVTSRMAQLPTWQPRTQATLPMPIARQCMQWEPGVELAYQRTLTERDDPAVRDHVFGGNALYPAVLSLATMVEAASIAAGRSSTAGVTISGLELHEPLVVSGGSGLRIRVHAQVTATEPDRVVVAVYSERDGFAAPKHAAVVHFQPPRIAATRDDLVLGTAIVSGPETYRHHLFQRGQFQRIHSIHELSATACTLRLEHRPTDDSIGDPFALDGVLQAAQLCLAGHQHLPVHIGRIELTSGFIAAKPATVRATVTVNERHGNRCHLDAAIADDRGRMLAKLTDYRVASVGTPPPPPPSATEALAALPALAARLGLLAPAVECLDAPDLAQQPTSRRRQSTALRLDGLLGSIGAPGTARVEFHADRPMVAGIAGFGAAVAHDGDLVLLAAGVTPVGCDVVAIAARPASRWCAMLGPLAHGARELFARGLPFDLAAAMVWATHECVLKATGQIPTDCSILAQERNHAVLRCGTTGVTVVAHTVTTASRPYVLAVTLSPGQTRS